MVETNKSKQNYSILKCASYMRYSNQKQTGGLSLEYQSNTNKNLISMIHGEFVGEFTDKAVSGFYTRLGAREGMSKLIQAIEDGKVNCVVFYDESRLSRRIIDVYKDFYWPIMKANPNVIFYRSSDGELWNPKDTETKQNLIDAYKESAKKKAYAVNAQVTMINSKIRPGSRLPLGVHAILSDRIVPDENLAIVLFIFELASWGYSEKKIASILSEMDFKLMLPNTNRKRKEGNEIIDITSTEKIMKDWSHTSIHYILNNPIYIGKGTWNRRLNRNNSSPGPKEQLELFGEYDPIIPVKLWNLVHAELDRKRIMTINEKGKEVKKASIRMDTTFKLSGIVQCSKCKQKLLTKNSSKSGKLYTRSGKPLCYYYCPSCKDIRVDFNLLDQEVIEQINGQLSNQYTGDAVVNKLNAWIKQIDKKLEALEVELSQEENHLQSKSYENILSKYDYEIYMEISLHSIELLKLEIEDLKETRKKCLDMISSDALNTLIRRIQKVGIGSLNVIEQRHIMFMTLDLVSIKTDRHGGVIIDELSFKKLPLPYLSKNA